MPLTQLIIFCNLQHHFVCLWITKWLALLGVKNPLLLKLIYILINFSFHFISIQGDICFTSKSLINFLLRYVIWVKSIPWEEPSPKSRDIIHVCLLESQVPYLGPLDLLRTNGATLKINLGITLSNIQCAALSKVGLAIKNL